MRILEECPYITPCGWCTRKLIECEAKKPKKKISLHEFQAMKDSIPSAEEIFFGKKECDQNG